MKIDLAELNVPAFLREKVSMKKMMTCLKRSRFKSSTITVFNNEVVGGFHAFMVSSSEEVTYTEYDGDVHPVQIALKTLSNIALECVMLEDEYVVLKSAFNKLNGAAEFNDLPTHEFPETHAATDVILKHISVGTISFMLALDFVRLADKKTQMDLHYKWKGKDVAACMVDWIDGGQGDECEDGRGYHGDEGNESGDGLMVSVVGDKENSGLKELKRLEDKIMRIDSTITLALFKKGKILTKINEEKLYRLKGYDFKQYCLETFGLSGGYCFKLLKMYRVTPDLMKKVSVSRLSWLHEHIKDDHLNALNYNEKLISDQGEVSLDFMIKTTLNKVESRIIPFAKPSVVKRIKSRGARQHIIQVNQYLKLVKGQVVCMPPPDRTEALSLVMKNAKEIERLEQEGD